jgi:DNA polymerase-3 subunit epsilon
MKFTHKALLKLSKNGLTFKELDKEFDEAFDLSLELLHAQGLNLVVKEEKYWFETAFTPLNETTFCIVDIETNGSKPQTHQIIEIGAVKLHNSKIIDRFESFVQCNAISSHISHLTGITVDDTRNAPPLKEVLKKFHAFLGTSVFVAHDVKFDYTFISAMMERVGLLGIMNRSLCTIDLTERTVSSYRYGLAYLNEQLELYKEATHHRALSDAITAAKLFKRTLHYVPRTIITAEDLINFSKEAKRLKRPKFDPSLAKKEQKKEVE